MKASFVLALLVAAYAALLRPAPAMAYFQVCNKMSVPVRLAIATDWYDYYGISPDYGKTTDDNVQGWTTIDSGACAVPLPGSIYAMNVFIYAYAPSQPSIAWTGRFKRCVDLKNTFNYGESLSDHEAALIDCSGGYPCNAVPANPDARGKDSARPPCTSGTEVGMAFVDTGSAGSFTENLSQ